MCGRRRKPSLEDGRDGGCTLSVGKKAAAEKSPEILLVLSNGVFVLLRDIVCEVWYGDLPRAKPTAATPTVLVAPNYEPHIISLDRSTVEATKHMR